MPGAHGSAVGCAVISSKGCRCPATRKNIRSIKAVVKWAAERGENVCVCVCVYPQESAEENERERERERENKRERT